jgi:integrase/recombinase XerD
VVKSLLTYAHVTGYCRFNVGQAVRGPKVDADADFRSLSQAEVGRLITVAERELRLERDRQNPRPRFVRSALTKVYLVRFLYYSACRVSEAVAVTWSDVRKRPDGDSQVTIVGKGRKRRSFPLPGSFVEKLRLEYAPQEHTPEARVFLLGARRAQTIVKELAERAGLNAGLSPHWLRHSAASHALELGAPVHVVQQTLGHASLATTTKYAHKREDGASKYLPRL